MNLLVPLLAALGVVLIYDGLVGRRGRRGVLMPALERLVIEAGVRSLTAARLMTLCTLVAVMGLVVVAGITSSIVVAVFFAVALAWVPIAVLKTDRKSVV